mmetsp:Transcript_11296/g.25012  ORF Transcript_11296/g.25012 Transcript_11296/m.25012 type:complete len:427 (+) Transcript_11296:130-1410(+)
MRALLLMILGVAAQPALSPRQQVCQHCSNICPVSCFVGSCSPTYGISIKRYGSTESCWTCDLASSSGIESSSDFNICTAEEAGDQTSLESATGGDSAEARMARAGPPPPAVPGDFVAHAADALRYSNDASASADAAIAEAKATAKAAAKAWSASKAASSAAGTSAQDGMKNAMAAAFDAARKAQAAAMARARRQMAYDKEYQRLKADELRVEEKDRQLQAAARVETAALDAAAKAKGAMAAEEARHAQMGLAAAGKEAAAAQAAELAAAARAAERKASDAALSAWEATKQGSEAAGIAFRNAPAQQIGMQRGPLTTPCPPAPAGGSSFMLCDQQLVEAQPEPTLGSADEAEPPHVIVGHPVVQPPSVSVRGMAMSEAEDPAELAAESQMNPSESVREMGAQAAAELYEQNPHYFGGHSSFLQKKLM